jgi:predicted Zn-dependent peptidase
MSNISKLSNGIKVVTQKIKGVKTISLGAYVKVGARHETPELNGISHFLEHMAFKGTQTRTAEQISFEIENVGGNSNAWTSHEMTAYHAKTLSEHKGLALDIISDSLKNSTYLETEIETERGVILQEINRSFDSPGNIAFNGLLSTAYKDQSIGRSVLGPPENIKNFKRDDFVNYVKSNYGANRMVISAAGDLKHDEIVDLAQHYFGDIEPSVEDNFDAARYDGGFFTYDKSFEQSTVICGWQAPSVVDESRWKWLVYAQYLGGGMSSPLFQEIREKRGLVYSVSAGTEFQEDNGLFYLYAGTTKEKLSELLTVGWAEIGKSTNEILESHLTRAKNQLKVSILKQTESQNSMMEMMASSMHYRGKIYDLNKALKKINAVTAEDLKSVATGILASKPTLSIVGKTDDVDYMGLVNYC